MRRTLFAIVLSAGLLAGARADGLPPPIAEALAAAGIPDSHIGIVIRNLPRGSTELAFGERRSFNPASVMKLVTTLASLDTLGPAHTFKTQVLTNGLLVDGTLRGDLILRGGGDPALTQERFWRLLREIQARGIHEIQGDVVIDNGFYAIEATDPAGFDEAPLKPYNAAPTALLVNYNATALRISPGVDGVTATLDPPGLPVDNQIVTEAAPTCDDWRERIDIDRDGDRLVLHGGFPAACGPRATWLNLMCPPATVSAYFSQTWRELGGRHEGQIRLGDAPEHALPLLEFESPPLSLIVRDINKFSNNVMAKMLFLDLGAARLGGKASWDKSDRAVRGWLADKGLDIPELVLDNGSGLSRVERLSAEAMGRLLAWAEKQPLYYEFAASLPALGQEGTLRKKLRDTPEAGQAWLKTGSLNGARNLAGYLLNDAGERLAMVLFINHPNASKAEGVQAEVIRWARRGVP